MLSTVRAVEMIKVIRNIDIYGKLCCYFLNIGLHIHICRKFFVVNFMTKTFCHYVFKSTFLSFCLEKIFGTERYIHFASSSYDAIKFRQTICSLCLKHN